MTNITGAQSIPKIIHYCWFGSNEKPQELQKYIDSWNMLNDYKIIEWNESNCTFDDNEFVEKAFKEKQWCFVSDYCRLKALYEFGGIYLDTDVKIFNSLDPLLNHPAFLNFIFNSSIGTAVIGAQKGNTLIKNLLNLYDKTRFDTSLPHNKIDFRDGYYYAKDFIPNNFYFTYYVLEHYPTFKLNNKYQEFEDFVIYPKEKFELGNFLKTQYTIHYCAGAWRPQKNVTKTTLKGSIRNIILSFPFFGYYNQLILRKLRYHQKNKLLPFYIKSKNQKQSLN